MKIIVLTTLVLAFSWTSLWYTPDQLGQKLMGRGQFEEAAEAFSDPMRAGVAWFRAGEFERAEREFARVATAEAEFNRGNCLVMLGKYEAAVERYEQALQSEPDWKAAETNRNIAMIRAERVRQEGGDMGDQKIGADEIVFDRSKKSGEQDTEVEGQQPLSDDAMQAMWLRRVQTKPSQFLKSKFAFQLATEDE